MRIRQVKPSFFTDGTMAEVSYAARLFYIGLWCVADDAGWMPWNLTDLGAVLYPHETPKARVKHMTTWAVELRACGRLVEYDCGCAFIPTLAAHQKVGGSPTYQHHRSHERHIRKSPDTSGDIPDSPPGKVEVGYGTVGNGSARATSDESPRSAFRDLVPDPRLPH
jgi:hypothetical protein